MGTFLGIDTSNYTSSGALFYEDGTINQAKKLLPVSQGQLGLRQSDALFHHTKQLSSVLNQLLPSDIKAVGVSNKPRNVEDSYMPCFLAGVNTAEVLAKALDVPIHYFSHQQGHLAALYSVNRLDLLEKDFLAFHLSGGTSEGLLVKNTLKGDIEIISETLDLNAGQVIDRVGKMLEFPFPSGKYLEELALNFNGSFKIKTAVKGNNFALSGVENLCLKMLKDGKTKEEISAFCLEYIIKTIDKVLENLIEKHKGLEIVFSGGVASNSIMRERFSGKYQAYFAEPIYSADNAAGIAVLTAYKHGKF
ncbi:MAG: peptidase M22 [Clostridia bacterium]